MAKKNLKRRKSINQTPSFTEQELIKFLQTQQPSSNKFSLGSQMTADSKAAIAENFDSAGDAVGAIGGMASGAMGIAGTTKNLATIDTSADEASIQNVANTDFTKLNSNTEALNAFYSRPTAQLSNLNKSGSEIAGGILQSTLTGAGAGASMGAWGAAAGAAAGLISSGVGALVGNAKANKEEERLRNEALSAEKQQMQAFNSQLGNIESNKSRLALQNMAAHGGRLNVFGQGGVTNGGDFSNGISFVNNGGTHEQNPYDGVQHSVDPQGVPNLVEEGEVIIDDYVYSNRLQIPASIQNKYKLKRMSFADAIKKLQKESEERPNDPISKAGLKVYEEELKQEQELAKERKKVRDMAKTVNSMSPQEKSELLMAAEQFAQQQQMAAQQEAMQAQQLQQGQEGQPSPEEMQMMQEQQMGQQQPQDMFAFGGNLFVGGGKEEKKETVTPVGAAAQDASVTIPYAHNGQDGVYLDYLPTENSYWHDQIFTDKTYKKHTPEYEAWHKGWNPSEEYIKKSRAELIKQGWTDKQIDARLKKEPDFFKNLSFDGYAGQLYAYAAQEFLRKKTPEIPETTIEKKPPEEKIPPEKKPDIPKDEPSGEYEPVDLRERQTISRYAPIAANALGLIMNNKDYTNADAIKQFKPTQVGFDPIGDYMTYKPMDTDYRANQLGQQNAATRSALINQAGGNRASAMAGILGADANYQAGLGELAREADLMNFENQARVKEFNRQTNQFNKEGAFRAQTANQGSDQLRYDQILKNAVMREAEDTAYNQTASQGLNNIANSLGAIGKENWMANIIDKNPALLFGVDGTYKQRPKQGATTTSTTSGPLVSPTQAAGKTADGRWASVQAIANQLQQTPSSQQSSPPAMSMTDTHTQGYDQFPINPALNRFNNMMLGFENPRAFGGKVKKRKKRK